MKKILFVFGTRPEAIKLAPIIRTAQLNKQFDVKVCVTAQHREMLDQVLSFFKIKPDFDLNLMKPGQTLFDITSESIKGIQGVLEEYTPDFIFVQGDTTTAFVGALAGFYKKIKVVHIEAGLRSNDRYSPFPEEMNRLLAGQLADFHFAPTTGAVANLAHQAIHENVWMVGNTVIDALLLGLDIIKKEGEQAYYDFFNFVDLNKKLILVTGHRRESFGTPFKQILEALKHLALNFPDVEIVFPVHLNPQVKVPVYEELQGISNIHLIEPLSYPHLIWLMEKSYLVITDSGGIQEEAPSLGKPVLVIRDVTERMEGVEAGTAKLVGTNKEKIINEASLLLTDDKAYQQMAKAVNPYGNGDSSEIIMGILENIVLNTKEVVA